MAKKIRIVNRSFCLGLLILASYQLWMVIDRWLAVFRYISKFGADNGLWVSLGLDTVIFGFISLLCIGFFSFWCRKKAKQNQESLFVNISTIAIAATAIAVTALLILIILPATGFR